MKSEELHCAERSKKLKERGAVQSTEHCRPSHVGCEAQVPFLLTSTKPAAVRSAASVLTGVRVGTENHHIRPSLPFLVPIV